MSAECLDIEACEECWNNGEETICYHNWAKRKWCITHEKLWDLCHSQGDKKCLQKK